MNNYTEMLDDIALRIYAFEHSGGEIEENLWSLTGEVLSEFRLIFEKPY